MSLLHQLAEGPGQTSDSAPKAKQSFGIVFIDPNPGLMKQRLALACRSPLRERRRSLHRPVRAMCEAFAVPAVEVTAFWIWKAVIDYQYSKLSVLGIGRSPLEGLFAGWPPNNALHNFLLLCGQSRQHSCQQRECSSRISLPKQQQAQVGGCIRIFRIQLQSSGEILFPLCRRSLPPVVPPPNRSKAQQFPSAANSSSSKRKASATRPCWKARIASLCCVHGS